MGRGSSKIGGGSGGAATRQNAELNNLIRDAMNGSIPVTISDVQAINRASYMINVGNLSDSDRDALAEIVYNSVVLGGPVASNSMQTVQNINTGNHARIKIFDMTSGELANFARIAMNSGQTINSSTVQDALKLISYFNL